MNINKRGLNKIIQEEIAKELDETFRNRYGSRRSERNAKKKLISEAQIKELIREEFASSGVILTEEQLEELFGLFGKSKLIKQIKAADADGTELDKLGYDANSLKGLPKSSLKQILGDLRDVTGTKEPKGFVQKVKDVYAGVKDIGILGGGAGTLLGGEETFDIEKRKALKGTAEKQLQGWLKKLKYPPATSLYTSLRKQGFPNNDENDFMANTAEIYNEYDKVVKDYEAKQIECDAANTIIAVLRALVIYFQDFGMADKYFYVNEQSEPEQEEKMGAAQGSVSKNFAAAYGNKLPLGLAAAGLGALAAGFTADSEFFQDFLQGFTDMENIPTTDDVTKSISRTLQLGDVQGGEGIIKVVRRLTDMKDFGTSGGPGLGQLADPKYKMVLNLVRASMISKEGPQALMQAIQKNANPAQLFVAGPSSGTAKVGEELFGLNKGSFEKNITKVISEKVKGIARAPADTIKNKFLGALGTFLGPVLKALGLSALVAALASFTMRQKGKGKMGGSRMSRLKGIVDEMVDIPCGDEPGPEDPCKDKPGTKWNPETKECEEDTGPEDPCRDKPGTKFDPETGECVCEEPGTVWSDKKGKCVKIKAPPGPRIGLINLDKPESDVYFSRRRNPDKRDADSAKFKKAQDTGSIGNPSKTPGVLDKGEYQDAYPQQPSVKNPRTKDYEDFVKRLRGRGSSTEPYFTVDGSVIRDAGEALKGVEGVENDAILKLSQYLVDRFATKKDKASSRIFRKAVRRYIPTELSKKQRAALYVVYADYGLTVPRSIQKEESNIEELHESLTLARWKVLSGVK
tara:strand:- start:15 stop:2420 length:2406 start_codon:yes stop_codon:yes gene_type:complete